MAYREVRVVDDDGRTVSFSRVEGFVSVHGFTPKTPDLIDKYRAALEYVSQPTMGLPGGVNPAVFAMTGAREDAARYALALCINQARTALGKSVEWPAQTTKE